MLFVVLLAAVSADAATARPQESDKPYKLVIDKDAAAAAKKAGFDLEALRAGRVDAGRFSKQA